MRQFWASAHSAVGVARRLLQRMASESPMLLVLGTLTAILQSALLIPIALVVRHMFDSEIPRRQASSIILSGVVIIVLYAVAAWLGYLARAAVLRTSAGVVRRLRLDLLAKLHALPQGWHDSRRMAAVHSVAVQDTERVETMLSSAAGNVLPATIIAAVLLITALVISPRLFLTGLVVMSPLMIVVRLLARRMRRFAGEWAQSALRYSAYAQLLLRAMGTTKVAGGESWALRRGVQDAAELAERTRRMGVAEGSVSAIENAIGAAAGTAVLVVGGIAVAHHSMTLGALVAFYAVLGLLLRQLHSLGWQSSAVVIGLQSLRDIEALLAIDEAEPYSRGARALYFSGAVSFVEVSFAYDDTPVLCDIALEIEPGEHIALIGPNGAGKSTIVSLLLGLYAPERGLLRANGVPYDELDIGSLRRQIGVVLQDPVLLPGTIRDNIAYARPDATDGAIRAAAQAATAAEFIEALPAGYATLVGDEGTGLSGGQRQRIAIARALLGAPALIVLDEPGTYLDNAAVATLMQELVSLPQQPTMLLVTHDLHVGSYVDRVIELRAGRIVRDTRARPSVDAAPA